jgi:hypothetical protein
MSPRELLQHRLINQHIGGDRLRHPAEIVSYLGAVQAQEYAMAKWAIGLRLPENISDQDVENALNRGEIIRTHVLRPTWHFVAPADLRWMLELTAPRVRASMGSRLRELEIDAALITRARSLVTKALSGGRFATRTALGAALIKRRIIATGERLGERLGHIMGLLELEGLICSGPREGKQFTYSLVDERVPAAKPLSRDAALANLAHRYFATRGPATPHDFAWWSGLTVTDARAGIESLGSEFVRETIHQQLFVFPTPANKARAPLTHFLMPDYDEYGIAYKDRSALRPSGLVSPQQSLSESRTYNRHIVLGGQIVGCWRRTEERAAIAVELVPFRLFTASERRSVISDAQRFAAFAGRDASVRFD